MLSALLVSRSAGQTGPPPTCCGTGKVASRDERGYDAALAQRNDAFHARSPARSGVPSRRRHHMATDTLDKQADLAARAATWQNSRDPRCSNQRARHWPRAASAFSTLAACGCSLYGRRCSSTRAHGLQSRRPRRSCASRRSRCTRHGSTPVHPGRGSTTRGIRHDLLRPTRGRDGGRVVCGKSHRLARRRADHEDRWANG